MRFPFKHQGQADRYLKICREVLELNIVAPAGTILNVQRTRNEFCCGFGYHSYNELTKDLAQSANRLFILPSQDDLRTAVGAAFEKALVFARASGFENEEFDDLLPHLAVSQILRSESSLSLSVTSEKAVTASPEDIASIQRPEPARSATLVPIERRRILDLAYDKSTNSAELRRIATLGDNFILRIVASHPNCPMDMLLRFADDPDVQIRAGAAHNPQLPEEILMRLIHDVDPLPRRAASHLARLTEQMFSLLSKDEDWLVRSSLASNDYVPSFVLAELGFDPGGCVSECAFMSVKMPAESFRRAFRELPMDSGILLYAIASNPSLPADCIESVLQYGQEGRACLASNPALTKHLFETLVVDKDYRVRESIASNRSTPEAILQKMITDKSIRVRKELALNPNLPRPGQDVLVKDSAESVRWAARMRLQQRAEDEQLQLP
jgi:hypothetical protein